MSNDTQPGTSEGNTPADTGNRDTLIIILAGFGIVGALAGIFIFHPEQAAENVITTVIGGIIGFIAGRKKA